MPEIFFYDAERNLAIGAETTLVLPHALADIDEARAFLQRFLKREVEVIEMLEGVEPEAAPAA